MCKFTKTLLLILLLSSFNIVKADDGLKMFGFFQGRLTTSDVTTDFPGFPVRNSFDVQQLNLMASNNFGDGFSAFVNFEFVNTYNTKEQWGSFNIQEAFAKYENSDGTFKVKAGIFLPQFNNLLEISNRTPLLPYIYRPLVYETQIGNILDFKNFLPQQGNFQIYGSYPLSESLKLDYAAYTGNLTSDFIDKTDPAEGTVGANNQTTALTYGGRVGISFSSENLGSLKLGTSYVLDKKKSTELNKISSNFAGLIPVFNLLGVSQDTIVTGDLNRNKLGVDFSYSNYGFTLTGEAIMVGLSDVAAIEKTLAGFGNPLGQALDSANRIQDTTFRNTMLGALSNVPEFVTSVRSTGDSFEKMFYFVTLQYDVNDDIYVYGTHSKIQDKLALFMVDGINSFSFGGGYRFVPQTILKLQYNNIDLKSQSGAYTENSFMLAVSVMF